MQLPGPPRLPRRIQKTIFLVVFLFVIAVFQSVKQEEDDLPAIIREIQTPNSFRPYFLHDFRRLLNPTRQMCRKEDQYLVIIVHSAPSNSIKRQLIRHTWGSPALLRHNNASLVFVMGSVPSADVMASVRVESHLHGDILQENFNDSYYNLTFKAVSWLKWVDKNCNDVRYVLKTDDDILADLTHVTDFLQSQVDTLHRSNLSVVCNYWPRTRVERKVGDKWYIPKAEFFQDNYGAICQGSAYILSVPLVKQLYRLTFSTPFFRLDDVYVTGFLVQQLPGVSVTTLNELYRTRTVVFNNTDDALLGRPMFIHNVAPKDHALVWSLMRQQLCSRGICKPGR